MCALTKKHELTYEENVVRRDVIDPRMVLDEMEWHEKGRMKEGMKRNGEDDSNIFILKV